MTVSTQKFLALADECAELARNCRYETPFRCVLLDCVTALRAAAELDHRTSGEVLGWLFTNFDGRKTFFESKPTIGFPEHRLQPLYAASSLPDHQLVQLRDTLKSMLALFDDEGNLSCTFSELQQAIWSGYAALKDTKPSYRIPDHQSAASHSQEGDERIAAYQQGMQSLINRINPIVDALEPFAALADKFDPVENDDDDFAWSIELKLSDLRRARAALAPQAGSEASSGAIEAAVQRTIKACAEVADRAVSRNNTERAAMAGEIAKSIRALIPVPDQAPQKDTSYCALCDLEHKLHEDAQGFHHVIKGERVACPISAAHQRGAT